MLLAAIYLWLSSLLIGMFLQSWTVALSGVPALAITVFVTAAAYRRFAGESERDSRIAELERELRLAEGKAALHLDTLAAERNGVAQLKGQIAKRDADLAASQAAVAMATSNFNTLRTTTDAAAFAHAQEMKRARQAHVEELSNERGKVQQAERRQAALESEFARLKDYSGQLEASVASLRQRAEIAEAFAEERKYWVPFQIPDEDLARALAETLR